MKDQKWKMPKWMEEYLDVLGGYKKGDIEFWMNDKSSVQINAPRALIAVEIKGKVGLLVKMRLEGMLGFKWRYGYDEITAAEHSDFYVVNRPYTTNDDNRVVIVPDWMAQDMNDEGLWWKALREVNEDEELCRQCGCDMEAKGVTGVSGDGNEAVEMDASWLECGHCG